MDCILLECGVGALTVGKVGRRAILALLEVLGPLPRRKCGTSIHLGRPGASSRREGGEWLRSGGWRSKSVSARPKARAASFWKERHCRRMSLCEKRARAGVASSGRNGVVLVILYRDNLVRMLLPPAIPARYHHILISHSGTSVSDIGDPQN